MSDDDEIMQPHSFISTTFRVAIVGENEIVQVGGGGRAHDPADEAILAAFGAESRSDLDR